MGTTRLDLYNRALALAGERSLADLNEETEARRLLDLEWNTGGVDACLEEGQWTFAMRTAQVDYDPDISPTFGFNRAFTKPTDFMRLTALCQDEYFRSPLTRYVDEAGYWYSDVDTIYVRYVSNDSSYGGDLGSWPQAFIDFAAAHFATKIMLKLGSDSTRYKLFVDPMNPEHTIRGRALIKAKSQAAMSNPPQFMAAGNWTRARQRGMQRRDGGNSSNLIG